MEDLSSLIHLKIRNLRNSLKLVAHIDISYDRKTSFLFLDKVKLHVDLILVCRGGRVIPDLLWSVILIKEGHEKDQIALQEVEIDL